MAPAAEGMRCALCGAGADVHCAADAAFLCAACDAQVHGANFLASRHRRTRVSPSAKCRDDDVSGTSSMCSCLSTADSATPIALAPRRGTPKTRPTRGEAVLRGWARRMGLAAPAAARRHASAAARALNDVAAAPQRMPLRVAMAAVLWREVAAAHGTGVHKAADALRRLEVCARVPTRLVLVVASSMGLASAVDAEEGWGECS